MAFTLVRYRNDTRMTCTSPSVPHPLLAQGVAIVLERSQVFIVPRDELPFGGLSEISVKTKWMDA